MSNNPYHAEMAYLIRLEKDAEAKLDRLRKEFATWKERIELAERAGRQDLITRAEERVDSLRQEARELRDELRLLVSKKSLLRKESRRPTGVEVDRAEALLESFRQSGLIDPDEASLEREFDDISKNRPLDEADDN